MLKLLNGCVFCLCILILVFCTTNGAARIIIFSYHQRSRLGIKLTSVELNLQQGAFFRTLYSLSDRGRGSGKIFELVSAAKASNLKF